MTRILENQKIVYVGNDWLTENKTSSHHIAEILSRKNVVLYIEGGGQRSPRATLRDIKKVISKVQKIRSKAYRISDNMYLYTPVLLPFHGIRIVRFFNKLILNLFVKKVCKDLEIFSPILWILVPHFVSLAGELNEKGIVYYCVDEYAAQPHVDSKSLLEMEDKLIRWADVVFTVSEPLFNKKKEKTDRVYLSLHGVDIAHFKKATNDNISIPDDLCRVPMPIAGFIGLIEEWVDLELISYLAQKEPRISFVFVGRVAQETGNFKNHDNVYFLGHKPYDILPNYLKSFDACLLPYKLNQQVINSNPKKMREYLTTGKPVVSVRIREVERYQELIYIADGYHDFHKQLVLALNSDTIEKKEKRIQAMEKESWEMRVDEISRIVAKNLTA